MMKTPSEKAKKVFRNMTIEAKRLIEFLNDRGDDINKSRMCLRGVVDNLNLANDIMTVIKSKEKELAIIIKYNHITEQEFERRMQIVDMVKRSIVNRIEQLKENR